MSNFLKQQKASKFGKIIGNAINISAQLSVPLALINCAMLVVTTGTALQNRGINITIWEIALVIVVVMASASLVVWKFILPNFYASWSEQFYRHSNPLVRDIQQIKKKLDIKDEDE